MGIFDSFSEKKSTNKISATAKNMVAAWDYPYKIYAAKTPVETIINDYEDALERGKTEGFIPVLVPVDETLEEHFRILNQENYSVADTLLAMPASGKQLLAERFEEYSRDSLEDFDMDMDAFSGEYDGEPEVMSGFSALLDYSTEDTLEIILFEIPTGQPWEVVAYLPFGGWNECPAPSEMAAICKHWYEEYGAIPTVVTHDVFEMRLPQPVPSDKALEVAKEHYAFTPDRVDQGTETYTLGEVAASIKVSSGWFFWWD